MTMLFYVSPRHSTPRGSRPWRFHGAEWFATNLCLATAAWQQQGHGGQGSVPFLKCHRLASILMRDRGDACHGSLVHLYPSSHFCLFFMCFHQYFDLIYSITRPPLCKAMPRANTACCTTTIGVTTYLNAAPHKVVNSEPRHKHRRDWRNRI